MQVKSNRGGARAGAGRPSIRNNTKHIGVRVPQDVADILDSQPNKSEYIVNAIRHYDEFTKGTQR